MLLSRLEEHAVAGPDDLQRPAARLRVAHAFGDEDRLTERMTVPSGACSGAEMDAEAAQPCGRRWRRDLVDVHRPGEPLSRAGAGVNDAARDLHVRSPSLVVSYRMLAAAEIAASTINSSRDHARNVAKSGHPEPPARFHVRRLPATLGTLSCARAHSRQPRARIAQFARIRSLGARAGIHNPARDEPAEPAALPRRAPAAPGVRAPAGAGARKSARTL